MYHPVEEAKYWSLKLTDLAVGGKSIEGASENYAVIDSGTSLIVGPKKVMDPITAAIGTVKQDCSNLKDLPDVDIEINKTVYTLTPDDYVLKVDSPIAGSGCLLGFMSMAVPDGFNYIIMGDVLMRKYYTNFDYDKKVVGMAPALHKN